MPKTTSVPARKPTVSVVIPVYNTDHAQLRDCLLSVLTQDLADYEVIAVNDGSPDPEIRPLLNEYAERFAHLRVINQRNGGGAKAINRGITAARGEYLTIMDHDDIMLSGALSSLYGGAKARNADMATGKLQRLEGRAEFWPELTLFFAEASYLEDALGDERVLKNSHYYNWIYRRRLFLKAVGKVPLRVVADFDMMHRMMAVAKGIVVVPETVYLWRRTANSITTTQGFFTDRLQVIIDMVRLHKEASPEYKAAFVRMALQRLSWYQPRYFDPERPDLTTLYASCLHEMLADAQASGLYTEGLIYSSAADENTKYLYKRALTPTREEAIEAFMGLVEKQQAENVAAAKVNPLLKLALTGKHHLKVAAGTAKGKAIEKLFPVYPHPFAPLSRWRKKGYPDVLQKAEAEHSQDSKTIMFESFLGKQYAGSPKVIYEYLLEHHPDYKFIWCYHGPHEDIPGYPEIVKRGTKPYYEALARSGRLVNNVVFPTWFYKGKKRYLQTWHGTPLKRLGFDIKIHGPETEARYGFFHESRNWGALLAANTYSADRFRQCFKFRKTMLTTGYPANDIFYHPEAHDRLRQSVRQKLGIAPDQEVYLYAPTWRDNKKVGNWAFSFDIAPDFDRLLRAAPDNAVVLLRHHHLTAEYVRGENPNIIDVSLYPDVYDLMVAADILISDYSSIFFDWACSRKPTLFYTPDYQDYHSEARGFYLDMEKDLGCELLMNETALCNAVKTRSWEGARWQETNRKLYDRFCSLHDGTATKQSVEWLLRDA